ncbi:MAG: type II toxin-antitoxin system prevent-host-death family antitoxin [Burkholderiaceae bacterium]|nr:type II toxin-antitoxin system prevent-host-death family antitoxin [Burkholderiaceae bacterium]
MDTRSKSISIAHAKAHLSELVSRAESGESILITRHGQPAARLVPIREAKQPLRSMAAFRKTIPATGISSIELIRQMRDEER